MKRTMDTKMLFILLVGLHVAESSYANDVETFFQSFGGERMSNCVEKANSKVSFFHGNDKKYAVRLINVYTQDCYYNRYNIFYRTLNAELRSGHPRKMWKTAGDLINKAIDIVGTKAYPVVYRGCSHNPGQRKSGDKYMFNQILSTSREANVAESFGCNGTLFILKNVIGADISSYSYFSKENEVLVKSTVEFTVDKDPITYATELQKIKENLGITASLRRVIYLNWSGDISHASNIGEKGALLVVVIGTVFVNYAATMVAL